MEEVRGAFVEPKELSEAEQLTNQRFSIESDQAAEWAFKKIRQYQDKRQAADKALADWKQEAERQHAEEVKEIDHNLDYFKGLLLDYAERQADGDNGWKFQSPAGRIAYTKPKATIVKGDEAKLLDQFKGTEYVTEKTTQKFNWADFRKTLTMTDGGQVVTPDGELVDGAKVKQEDGGFKIKNKPEGAKQWREV